MTRPLSGNHEDDLYSESVLIRQSSNMMMIHDLANETQQMSLDQQGFFVKIVKGASHERFI